MWSQPNSVSSPERTSDGGVIEDSPPPRPSLFRLGDMLDDVDPAKEFAAFDQLGALTRGILRECAIPWSAHEILEHARAQGLDPVADDKRIAASVKRLGARHGGVRDG